MFAKDIIQKHISSEDIHNIISHNGIIFLRSTIKTIVFLFVSFLLYYVLSQYIDRNGLKWIFAAIGIGFFVKFLIEFMDSYLDCLVLSGKGITFFSWDGMFSYKTDFFEWNKIEAVSHSQTGMRDNILAKGDIVIKLEHGIEYTFDNVSNPKKQVKHLMMLKDKHGAKDTSKKDIDQFAILTEALSEVVKEYLDKKTPTEDTEEDTY